MRSTRIAALATALATLALAPGAAAGGWATVGVSPLPDQGAAAGSSWTPTLTVLQHGRTPLDDVRPTITLTNGDTGETFVVGTTRGAGSGQHVASVTFPTAGTWSYAIDDGFSRTHTFPPVRIGSSDTGGAALSTPWTVGGSAALALMLGALVLLGRRPSGRTPLRAPALR